MREEWRRGRQSPPFFSWEFSVLRRCEEKEEVEVEVKGLAVLRLSAEEEVALVVRRGDAEEVEQRVEGCREEEQDSTEVWIWLWLWVWVSHDGG